VFYQLYEREIEAWIAMRWQVLGAVVGISTALLF
jgi:hypothetical protein